MKCVNCKKYKTRSCSVLKQEGKEPGPWDWCAAFKKICGVTGSDSNPRAAK